MVLYRWTSTLTRQNKKLSYRRGTARCVVSIEILPIATQQCSNYLYDKSWPNRWYEVGDLVGSNALWTMCTQPWRNRVGSHCLRCHKQTDDGRVVYITCIPTTCCGEIILSPRCRNCLRDPDHAPFRKDFSSAGGTCYVSQCTKFEVSRFTRYEAVNGGAKCRKWGDLGWLGGTQGHGQCHLSIERIRLPIRLQ